VLKTRILTALIIFAATLAAVFLSPPWLFQLLTAILLLTGCWEFRRLADLPRTAGWALQIVQTLIIALLIYYWPTVKSEALTILSAGCAAWLLMFCRLPAFHDGARHGPRYRFIGFLSALGAITSCWFALSWLQDQPEGPYIIFLPLLIIWASDVGAYFTGKQFGRRKLAPVISPKKTWEGVYGGIALAIAAAFLWSYIIAGLEIPGTSLLIMTVVSAFASVGGDLFISIHKRTVGLKDTGTIFPGHGGILDRYDSLLAGAPFFALAYGVLAL
jgi:phosphatidate cytidylyltransferase